MVILDVHDQLGERLEVESAAPEATYVGEEGGSGDPRHGVRLLHGPGQAAERGGRHADTGSQTAAVAAGATGSSGAQDPEEGP